MNKQNKLFTDCPECKGKNQVNITIFRRREISAARVHKCVNCGHLPGMKELYDFVKETEVKQ